MSDSIVHNADLKKPRGMTRAFTILANLPMDMFADRRNDSPSQPRSGLDGLASDGQLTANE
jgi:hypothetical protein